MKSNTQRRRLRLAPGCEPLESRNLLSTATTTAASTAASNKLSRDISRYYLDVNALNLTTRIPSAQLATLQADSTALHAVITTPPSNASLNALTKTLKSFHGKTFTAADTAAFEAGLTAVFDSTGVTNTSLIQKDVDAQVAAISAAGVTPAELAKLATIEQSIAKDSGGAQTGAVGLG